MELILVRHTKVAVTDVCYGFSDVDLANSFLSDKEEVLRKIETNNDIVISSSSGRCTKLASYISSDYKVDERIKELNFGDWELQKWDDITDPKFNIWMNDYINYKCPNGESFIDMKNRVGTFYNEIICKEHEKVIIVTHGGVIRLFHHFINNLPLDKVFDLKVEYGSVNKFVI